MATGGRVRGFGDRRTEQLPPVGASDLELLCSLLSGGTGVVPCRQVGEELLKRFGSLVGVLRETPSSLAETPGIGARAVARLRATREAAGRLWTHDRRRPRLYVSGPEDVADLMTPEMALLDREHFRAILLNTKNRILGIRTISIGSLNSSVVHAREVFKAAVSESAQAIVLVHNHPSGIPEPSTEDIVVTDRLSEAGRILGIEVLDHVIVAHDGFTSMKELGHL